MHFSFFLFLFLIVLHVMIVSSKIWGSATWVLNILLKYPSCGIHQILCEFFLLPCIAFLKSFFLSSLIVFINFKKGDLQLQVGAAPFIKGATLQLEPNIYMYILTLMCSHY